MGYANVVMKAVALLKKTKVPYVLTGGLAAACYGTPRTTMDVDFLIPPVAGAQEFLSAASEAGFIFDKTRVRKVLKSGGMISIGLSNEPYAVDLIVRSDIADVLARSRSTDIYGMRVKLISPEDLLLGKLTMWRSIDRLDVPSILVKQHGKLDLQYLRGKAKELGIRNQLEKVMEAVSSAR